MYTQGIAMAMSSDENIGLNDLRALVQMILMEGLSRKVTQQFFSELLYDTTEFLTHIARLEAAVHAKHAMMMTEPERGEPPVLEEAITKMMLKIMGLRAKMAEKTMQMAQCQDNGVTNS